MVTQLRLTPVPVFRVHDREGRPIGEVSDPRDVPVMGRGAGTVLLRPAEKGSEAAGRASAA